ncbi:hypothetical protein HK104_008501 [Borealophlyctis nickersoniae]|nr:hypothetical protein HK104_008501 [Borealophlyctis nickersoniae]
MASLDAGMQEPSQQTEPVVFLWSVTRWTNESVRGSARFGAFGKIWRLCLQQYEEQNANAFGVWLCQGTPNEPRTRFNILIRKELSGPDLYRRVPGQKMGPSGFPTVGWGISVSRVKEQQLGIELSMIVGVAIYPTKTPKSNKLFVPSQTATSSILHQRVNSDVLHVVHSLAYQAPILECGIFLHLLSSSVRSDVTFIVEQQEIPAQATVLLNDRAGPYFAGLLAHEFKEKKDGKVLIDGVAYKIFKAILEYVYTGRTAVDSVMSTLPYLYSAADRFQVTTLLPYIKHELILSIRQVTLAPKVLLTLIQQMRPFPDLSDVVQICVNRVLENWSVAKTSDKWRALFTPEDLDLVERFVNSALKLQKESTA